MKTQTMNKKDMAKINLAMYAIFASVCILRVLTDLQDWFNNQR